MFCSQCVLPDNYPNIEFDTQGVCNFCRSYKKKTYLGAEALEMELKTRLKRNKLDTCVVPVSGGKDSTYVLYYLTKVLGFKTIAVNYDNGFTHPQATENLRQITERLKVELFIIRGTRQKKLMMGNLRSFLSRPSAAMVPLMCTGCRFGIVSGACKVARERNINLFVIGWSGIEDTPFKSYFLTADGGSEIKGLAKNLVQNPRYLLHGGALTQALDYYHNYSHVCDWGPALRTLYPGIRPISFFDYIEYNPEHIQQVVADEAGWSCPSPETFWQFDCQIKLIQNSLYSTLVGFTAYNDYLSTRIREGYITQEYALELLKKQKERAASEHDHVRTVLFKNGTEKLVSRFEEFVQYQPLSKVATQRK